MKEKPTRKNPVSEEFRKEREANSGRQYPLFSRPSKEPFPERGSVPLRGVRSLGHALKLFAQPTGIGSLASEIYAD